MSVVAYADESTSLAEASGESAAVAEVTESEIAPISAESVETSTVSDMPVIESVDLDEIYIELYLHDILGNISSVFPNEELSLSLTDINGNKATGIVDPTKLVGNTVIVFVDTKTLDTTNALTVECSSSDFVLNDFAKTLKVQKMDGIVMGSQENPVSLAMDYVKERFISVKTVDSQGIVVANVPLELSTMTDLKVDLVTDNNGIALLSATKYFGETFSVKSKNSKYAIPSKSVVTVGNLNEVLLTVNVDKSKVDESALVLNVKTEVLTDISSNWAEFTLELTDSNGAKQSIVNKSVGVTTQKIASGTYSINVVDSPYCTVKVDKSISVSGATTLNVNVYPLSTFEVYDGGKEYDFEILGVSHLEGRHYTGTAKKVFGVMPGTVVQLKSDGVDKAYTVSSENSNETVTVELSKGTTSATPVGAPKTFDIIDALLLLAALLLLSLIAGGIYLYKSGNLKSKNVTAMLLVLAMLCTMVPDNFDNVVVYADSDGGTADVNIGSTVTANYRVWDDLPVVLKFTLYPTMPNGATGAAPLATHENSPFYEKSQPILDEYSALQTNPLDFTLNYDFSSLYLVLDSSHKSDALSQNNAVSWREGGVLRYTNGVELQMGYNNGGYQQYNWEKQLRTVYANKPSNVEQYFETNLTTPLLRNFGELLKTKGYFDNSGTDFYIKNVNAPLANELNAYMHDNVLLERDALLENKNSPEYKTKEEEMKKLIDAWEARIDEIYSSTDGVRPVDTTIYNYWKESLDKGYATIIVEPYVCVYDNINRPQFFNTSYSELSQLGANVYDPNYVIKPSGGSRPQWKRYAKLLYPSTIATGGVELPQEYWGWGQYSIVGFEEKDTPIETTPLVAVTYDETTYWDNDAIAEAFWNGSYTAKDGSKVDFPFETTGGEPMNANVLKRGILEKLEQYENNTLPENERVIFSAESSFWYDAISDLERIESVAPDLQLKDFKNDVLKLVEFADTYGNPINTENFIYYPSNVSFAEGEVPSTMKVLANTDDADEFLNTDFNVLNIDSLSGFSFGYMWDSWLADTMLPDDIRNDGESRSSRLERELYEGQYSILEYYSERMGLSDSQKEELRDKMRDFAHDMAIRSAFYNIAAMTLAEKNIAMGSWDLYYTHKLGQSMDSGENGRFYIDNTPEENDDLSRQFINGNDLGHYLNGEYSLNLQGSMVNSFGDNTNVSFDPNTEFTISARIWRDGKNPDTQLEEQKALQNSGSASMLGASYISSLSQSEKEAYVYDKILLNGGVKANVNILSTLLESSKATGSKLGYFQSPEDKTALLTEGTKTLVENSGGTDGETESEIITEHIDTVGAKGSTTGMLAKDVKKAESNGAGLLSETVNPGVLLAATALSEGNDAGYNYFINELVNVGVSVPQHLADNARNGETGDSHLLEAKNYIYSLLNEYTYGAKNYINTSTGTDYLDPEDDRYIKSPVLRASYFGVTEPGDAMNIDIDTLRVYWPEVDKALAAFATTYDIGNKYGSNYAVDPVTKDPIMTKRAVLQLILTIRGSATNITTVNPPPPIPSDPIVGLEFVPQWRINKSYSGLASFLEPPNSIQTLTWYINTSSLPWGSYKSIYPKTGGSKAEFYLKGDISGNSHNAYVIPSKSKKTNEKITYSSASRSASANSDITMYKVDSVDKINTASWVSDTLTFNKNGKTFVTTESKNVHSQTDAVVSDSFDIAYKYLTDKQFTYEYWRYIRYWGWEDYYSTPTPSTDKNSVTYNISGNFLCYNAEDTTSKPGAATVHAEEGYSEFTALQGNLKVLPEVPMLYTDVNGNNSVHFTTGDKLRSLKPLSYHTFEYDMDTINPSVVGTSIATDQKALSLLNSMGMGATADKAQVIHKGAGTTTSYDVTGVIRTKTYAIDIDDSSLKSTWNSGSTYSASAINKSFLESFATANATGGYTANIDAVENLMVDGNKLGDVYQNVTITANGTSSERYELTVRAGVVTAVNGKKNWKTVYPELVPVIEEKLGLTPNRVFAAFASEKGDALNERVFETLSKALRENSSSIEEGKGWYSEDTTVLSLYVYTTEFDIPNMLFANKIPQEISAVSELATPRDKTKFYNVGRVGHLNLDLCLKGKDSAGNVLNVKLTYNTANAYPTGMGYANAKKLFVIPNVSILDTTLNQ